MSYQAVRVSRAEFLWMLSSEETGPDQTSRAMTNAIKLKGDACQSGGEESSVSDFRISSEVDPEHRKPGSRKLGPGLELKSQAKRSERPSEWKGVPVYERLCVVPSSLVPRPRPSQCKEGGVVVK